MTKIEGKIIYHPEELIQASTKVPKEPERFFKHFIKSLESKTITIKGASSEISEIGPVDGLSTKFQVIGIRDFNYDFSVRFEIIDAQTNAYFDAKMELTLQKKGVLKSIVKNILKATEGFYSSVVISYIKNLTNKSIEYINSAPEPLAKPLYMTQDNKGEGISVFVSYATKDAPSFRIEEIAEELTKTEEIDDVLYWQEDNKDNIIEYMNENLGKCEVVILFCSPNSLNSVPVQKEWTAAEGLNKPIIPVFLEVEHIPPLLITREGVKFDPFDFEKNIQELYKLIVKKSLLIQ